MTGCPSHERLAQQVACSKLGRLQKKDVVLQMNMLVEVILELIQLPIGEHEGIADISGYRIPVGEGADSMNGIADLFMFTAESLK